MTELPRPGIREDTAQRARFERLEQVIADPLRFKLRLGIGEEAYADLRLVKRLQTVWDVAGVAASGAAVAKSSAVAGAFFGGHGLLAALGLVGATTPAGWVVAAGLAAGGAYWGVTQLFRRYADARVAKIPAFLNTPLDLLGMSLLDLMAPLILEVARSDGPVTPAERAAVLGWLTREWGYDPAYAGAALEFVAGSMAERTIEDLAAALARFKRANPDCNFAHMRREFVGFLTELARSGAVFDTRRHAAIARIDAVFAFEGRPGALRCAARLRDASAAWICRAGALPGPADPAGARARQTTTFRALCPPTPNTRL